MTIHRDLSLEALGAAVCTALAERGIDVVLTGGAVVSIYSSNAYQSDDLDFIIRGLFKRVDEAMTSLGFSKTRARYWTHPQTTYYGEFPPGPLEISGEPVRDIAERRTPEGTLRLLPPTECVMDRLTAYYYLDDPQGLEQAIAVARAQPVDLRKVERWSRNEDQLAKHAEFVRRLQC